MAWLVWHDSETDVTRRLGLEPSPRVIAASLLAAGLLHATDLALLW